MKDLENLERIEIQRCFIPDSLGEIQRAELHHFSDASSQGYGQCSYIRVVSRERVCCSLIMGKARVAPTKIVTIPRLELTAAVTSASVSSTLKEDLYAKKWWRRVQYLTEQFWHRWRKEYLANIALRQQWHAPRRNVEVGDIVILKEEDVPRNEWKLTRVVEAHEDDDGLVRKVTIQTGDRKLGKRGERLVQPSVIQRPIQKLVVLVENEKNMSFID
nr:uncharacterized protein LOC129162918 [Nothobranchius furzeri]